MVRPIVTFVSPNLILNKSDLFTTGIVFMPFGLAYFVGTARREGIDCRLVDAFGEKPNQVTSDGDFLVRGLTEDEVLARVDASAKVVCLYAMNLTYHRALLRLIAAVRARLPGVAIVVLENSQAVTAYSLRIVQDELHAGGADYIVVGDLEDRGLRLLQALGAARDPRSAEAAEAALAIEGVGARRDGKSVCSAPATKIKDLDALALPAWDLLPLENYWSLKYSHGPFEGKKYLPILTSRGCPYACRFCVIPATNDLKWRPRSAESVVDEMAHFRSTMGVTEFHVEDVDPTVDDRRTRAICAEILRRQLKITWRICSGTKVETLKNADTIRLMARAGCRYISISPESGSPKVMKLIQKPFKYAHAIELVRAMNEVGIRSQACFVLGFPGEEDEDRELTRLMARDLTRNGLDEIAVFVITPVPGSSIFAEFSGYANYSQLNFSPTWRVDYGQLNAFRIRLYREFLLLKLRTAPLKILRQCLNFALRRFETKMEMTPFRALHTYWISRQALEHK